MHLADIDLGRSREVHFNRANAAIDDAMRRNPEFAEMMERLSPGIQERVSTIGGRENPEGFVWHHAPELGLMQLVPTEQHTSGSTFWKALHYDPQSKGGYSIWAIPRGAPNN